MSKAEKDSLRISSFITEALAMEEQEARDAGAIGFVARSLVQAGLPHKRVQGAEFVRTNGAFTLSLLAPSKVGLPFGVIPRLVLSWLTTEAVRGKQREIVLGDSLSQWMRELGMEPTGGSVGTITRLKDQLSRLFSCSISCTYEGDGMMVGGGLSIADEYRLWWIPKEPEQIGLFASTVTLSQRFYDEIIAHPVPVDLRALKLLRKSPMALDLYCWLTYRMSYLKKPTVIPWESLMVQFGAGYTRPEDFKRNLLIQLRKVLITYPEAKVFERPNGVELRPSPPHVPSLRFSVD